MDAGGLPFAASGAGAGVAGAAAAAGFGAAVDGLASGFAGVLGDDLENITRCLYVSHRVDGFAPDADFVVKMNAGAASG